MEKKIINPPGDYLRDAMAMAAMTGDMSRENGAYANLTDNQAAKRYYEMADAMLKAREVE